jgi:hypothetical protein
MQSGDGEKFSPELAGFILTYRPVRGQNVFEIGSQGKS